MLDRTVAQKESRGREAVVEHLRHIVLWPLQLVTDQPGKPDLHCGAALTGSHGTWALLEDEFGTGRGEFQERHYREFVSFLPHVQRFLYGDAPGPVRHLGYGDAPLRVYRRKDVARVRIALAGHEQPIELEVPHIDLYTFYDVDVVVLAVEIAANELPLSVAQLVTHQFGRAYPPGWTEDGAPLHCPRRVEWLGASGRVLATSDYENRAEFLDQTGLNRAPRIAAHWEFILSPLVAYASEREGALRFRQIEYYRMPEMSFLAVDDMDRVDHGTFLRLAHGSAPGEPGELPFAEGFPADFEQRYCYDRFFMRQRRPGATRTRFLCCGHAFSMVVETGEPVVMCNERGFLSQFRHQYFLLFLIAHFHKAALLMLSDRLVAAIKRLDPSDPSAIAEFRRRTHALHETFMRFTHRYWFTEVSDQPQARDLYALHKRHLGTEALYADVRKEIFDMVTYLDSDLLRRQSGSMHRLTVVTILGLIGTTVTGFLGMNLIAEADATLATKVIYFGLTTAVVVALTTLTITFSKRLTVLFDRLTRDIR